MSLQKAYIEAMLKHLPPSAAQLQLWDVGRGTGDVFPQTRKDIVLRDFPADLASWPPDTDVADSVTALNYARALDADFLRAALRLLRPGGRLVMVVSDGKPDKQLVAALESAGYMRILVEPAVSDGPPSGVLIRGEKPHRTHSTFARVRVAADNDADMLTFATYEGPYVFLLVRQHPNKPVWALRPDEEVTWQAVAANDAVLAFTSLPKAVSFMQGAVMQGVVENVNKVPKFSRETAENWARDVWLNPTLDRVKLQAIELFDIDPKTAEAPDE